MKVLGLDPSLSSFGWAVHDTEATGRARIVARGHIVTASKTLYVDRYVHLREQVRILIKEHKPDKVAIEAPIFGETWSEGAYGLFLFVSEALRTSKIDAVLWMPPQIKAHAREIVGRPDIDGKKWKMGKGDMVEAAQWDTRKSDTDFRARWKNDEADAYMAAVLGGRFWMFHEGEIQEEDLTPLEHKLFLEVKQKRGRSVKKGTLYRQNDRFFLWSQE